MEGDETHFVLVDNTLKEHLIEKPSITYKRSQNLRDILVRSHHTGQKIERAFGFKGPKWGSRPCVVILMWHVTFGTPNIHVSSKSLIQLHVIQAGWYIFATCPCRLSYISLTSRQLRHRVREHVLGITAAREETDLNILKPIPRHFKLHHDCDARGLRVRGIDREIIGARGGNWKRILALRESKWYIPWTPWSHADWIIIWVLLLFCDPLEYN